MKQNNTVRDTLRCPKCQTVFTVERHSPKDVKCLKCDWDGSFHYEEE